MPVPTPPCAVCGSPVAMQIDPSTIRFSCGATSTAIIIEHPQQATCPNCRATLHLVIVGFQGLQMKTAPVPAAKRQLVIPVDRIRVG